MKRLMSRKMILAAAVLTLLSVFLNLSGEAASDAEKAPVFDVITVSAAITPPIAEYIIQSIDEAAKSGAEGLIIRLDTPGGLDLAMRDIAKEILNAPVPVIVYVAPSGARAASAGVIITVSAHIAAMAPGTNIGAAHPVGMGIGGRHGQDDEPEGGKRRRRLCPRHRQETEPERGLGGEGGPEERIDHRRGGPPSEGDRFRGGGSEPVALHRWTAGRSPSPRGKRSSGQKGPFSTTRRWGRGKRSSPP